MTRTVVEHGGPDLEELRRLGIDPATLLDFSVCTNPFGPVPPHVAQALAEASVESILTASRMLFGPPSPNMRSPPNAFSRATASPN